MLTLKEVTQEEDFKSTHYTCNEVVKLAGDSIWDCVLTDADEIRVTDIILNETDWGDDSTSREIAVYYTVNGVEEFENSWTIYTDTGFAAEISRLLGEEVYFTEQGMQDDGRASME